MCCKNKRDLRGSQGAVIAEAIKDFLERQGMIRVNAFPFEPKV